MSWTKQQARNELAKIRYMPAKYKATANRVADGKIMYVVMHDMEAPENTDKTAEGVASFFQTTDRPASAHVNVDRDSEVRSVHDKDVAYHAPGASHNGIGLEQAGYARQTRAEWLDGDSMRVIKRSSRIAALDCAAYDVTPRWLTNAELRAGRLSGIIHHLQVSQVFGRSSHWDCGYGWPSDVFMSLVWGWLGDTSHNPDDLPEPLEAGMAIIAHPSAGPDADHLWVVEGNVASVLKAESDRQHLVNLGLLRQPETVEVPEAVFARLHKFPGSP